MVREIEEVIMGMGTDRNIRTRSRAQPETMGKKKRGR